MIDELYSRKRLGKCIFMEVDLGLAGLRSKWIRIARIECVCKWQVRQHIHLWSRWSQGRGNRADPYYVLLLLPGRIILALIHT